MRRRRLKKQAAALEVTAFINLIVVLVPFLLSTAVFSKLSVMELALPAAAAAGLEQLKAEDLQLEIVLREGAIEVGDRIGGLIQRIPDHGKAPDGAALLALLQGIKSKFPDEVQTSVLAEADTPYEHIIKVMDVSREAQFPEVAVGDAPLRTTP